MGDKAYKIQLTCGFVGVGIWLGAAMTTSTWEWMLIGFTMCALCLLGVQQTWENWQFHKVTVEAKQRWNALLTTVESEIDEIKAGEKKQ